MSKKWIGVDLDGTLAHHNTNDHVSFVGAPIMPMVERVKKWIAEGRIVKIMTARVSYPDAPDQIDMISKWCAEHLGVILPVTCVKDGMMEELWDDRVVTVERNTGYKLGVSRIEADQRGSTYELALLVWFRSRGAIGGQFFNADGTQDHDKGHQTRVEFDTWWSNPHGR